MTGHNYKNGGKDRWHVTILRITDVITVAIRVMGLAVVFNEVFVAPRPIDAVAMGVAGFMVAGATGIDSLAGNLLNKK
jgi:hypothetical protein